MKKFIDYTTLAIGLAVAAGIAFHFDVGKEVVGLLKNVVHKIAPWINTAVYS